VLLVIPARLASTRFYAKPLALINGKPMVQWVYEQCCKVKDADVIIATDHQSIEDAALQFGAKVALTSLTHISGTDRVAEIALKFPAYEYIINVQGDEPCISPDQINAVLKELKRGSKIVTLKKFINSTQAENPNIVKVVCDSIGNARYFSRAKIPFEKAHKAIYYKHIGIYGFCNATLIKLTNLPMGNLEQIEQLEQLRWLENGYKIRCVETNFESPSVDVPEDIEKVTKYLSSLNNLYKSPQ